MAAHRELQAETTIGPGQVTASPALELNWSWQDEQRFIKAIRTRATASISIHSGRAQDNGRATDKLVQKGQDGPSA